MIPSANHTPPNLWGKLVLLIGANLTLISGAGLTAAMPAMLKTFEDVPGAALWVSMVITLPALFVVIGGPLTGFLTDRFGRKPILVGSILLSGLAGTGAFFLNQLFAILITRALVGISIAGAMTATNALIADYFSGQARAKFMGYQSAFLGLGVILFMPIGGILADISWEYTFLSYLPVLLIFLPALFAIREPEMSRPPFSLNQKIGIRINSTQGLIFGAVFVLMFAFVTIPVFLAYFMSEILSAGGTEVGLVGGLSGLMTFFGGMSYERIGRRLSYPQMIVGGFLLCGAGFIALGLASSWVLIIMGTSIVGYGLGLNMANLTTWLAHVVSPDMRGRANGIFMTMRFLAEFLGSLAFTPIINLTSYNFGYILSAVIVISMGFATLIITRPASRTGQA
jgi:MFS family permease